jgi:hypothetical protein
VAQFGPPLLFALVVWWFSTGAILWLVRRPERTFAPMLAVGGMLAAAALAAAWWTREDASAAGAYAGFAAALIVWGWHEAAFLTGAVTGLPSRSAGGAGGGRAALAARAAAPPQDELDATTPQQTTPLRGGSPGHAVRPPPAPPAKREGSRFFAAASSIIHHELALAATLVILVALTWKGANQSATLTFALLFALRLSTKFNLFLGVPNPPKALLPARIEHLAQHFRRRAFNPLMPISLLACIAATAFLAQAALHPTATLGAATGYALLFGLAALGVIEHLFLMLPSPDRALWGWALGAPRKADTSLALAGAREP